MRVEELARYLRGRIERCRRTEEKYGRARGTRIPQMVIEAWSERMALQRVLDLIGGEP